MPITFHEFAAGRRPNLKHAPSRVLGWLTTDHVENTETRYAMFADGRVLRSAVSLDSRNRHTFAPKRVKWTAVETVPADAEFCGHYNTPVV
jgi:hypothetical protein